MHDPAAIETISQHRCFGGTVGFYRHWSTVTDNMMRFSVFLPPQAASGPVPVLYYLAGLTCTEETFMTKAGAQQHAAKLGLALVAPDTSPRGAPLPGDKDSWDFGIGAGFYVDATVAPWAQHYRMYSYVTAELPALIDARFPVDRERQGIFGHSMGGHGAITFALKNPGRFRSVSAFAPIVHPSTADWSRPAFTKYLGSDEAAWRAYDTVSLIEDGRRVKELLVDQGTADPFLENGLRPWLLTEPCARAGIDLTLSMREGYDHSYHFISTFMADHVAWHAARLHDAR
jgi:S-formylglutathione hydrolase